MHTTAAKRVGLGGAALLLAAWWAMPGGELGVEPVGAPRRRWIPPPSIGSVTARLDEGVDGGNGGEDPVWMDSTTLAIVLPEAGDGRHLVWPRTAALDPAVYWPRELGAGAPLGEALQEMIDLDLPVGSASERDWVDAVFDTLPTLSEGPEAALLALEATRRAEQIVRADQLEQEALGLPDGVQVAPEALLGPEDPVDTEDLALALVEAWPEAPEADVGRLYLVQAAVVRGDAEVALALFAELDETGAPLEVLAQAGGALSRLDPREVRQGIDRASLVQLGAVLDAAPDAVAALDLASFGVELALERGEAVGPWVERLHAAYASQCGDGDGDGEDEGAVCAHHAANLDDLVAQLGGLAPEDAVDWRQGAKIAAVRCAAGVRRPLRVEAEGTWTGRRWSFGGWDAGPASYTGCVERGIAAAPAPDGAVRVRFTVIGYP